MTHPRDLAKKYVQNIFQKILWYPKRKLSHTGIMNPFDLIRQLKKYKITIFSDVKVEKMFSDLKKICSKRFSKKSFGTLKKISYTGFISPFNTIMPRINTPVGLFIFEALEEGFIRGGWSIQGRGV